MIAVRYLRSEKEPVTWLPGDSRAVPADGYESIEEGQCGITRSDVADGDIAPLSSYPMGERVYIEADEADDVLDDETDETAEQTRIWWLAVLVQP